MKQDPKHVSLFKYLLTVFGLNLFKAKVPVFERGLMIGDTLITAEVQLGSLKKDDVRVEIFHGNLDALGQLPHGSRTIMECIAEKEGGVFRFQGSAPCDRTGQLGCTVRILPNHPDLGHEHEMGLITWA